MDIRNTITLVDKFSPTLNKVNKSLHTTLNVMKRLDKNMTMGKFNTQAIKSAQAVNKLETNLNKASNSAKRTKTAFDSVKGSLAANFAVGNLATMAIWNILGSMKQAIVGGMDYASGMVEVQNVVNKSYGDMTGEANKWAKGALKSYGLNELSALKYIGTLNAQIQASGLARVEAGKMAMGLTGLAGDLASFYNIPIEQAFNKIRSGLAGTVMPLRQLGIDMTVATLHTHALTMGINKKWKEMSQAEKTIVRYNYLMKITSKQQGDFVQTFYTFANQQRYSEQLWMQLTGAIMKNFLPAADLFLIAWNKMLEGFLSFGVYIKSAIGNLISALISARYYIVALALAYSVTLIPTIWASITAFYSMATAAMSAALATATAWVVALTPIEAMGALVIAVIAGIIAGMVYWARSSGVVFEDIVGGFFYVGQTIENWAKNVINFISPVVEIFQALQIGILASVDALQGTKFAESAKAEQARFNKWKASANKDPNKAFKEGKVAGYKFGTSAKDKISKTTAMITGTSKIPPIDGLDGASNGSPKGTKSDPIHTKIDKDDITLLVEVAKTQITNQYTRLQPILQAKFGDVRETADIYDMMNTMADMMSDAYNNNLGTR